MLIDVDDRAAYAYTGGKPFDPRLPVVVLIHGAQHDHSVWALQSRYLAHHGRAVLAVDLPGHGRSAGPALATVEAMAGWVLTLLRNVGAMRASLVGHSMGALIALEATARCGGEANSSTDVAASRPHGTSDPALAIDALVLIAVAYPMQVSDLLLDTTRDDEPRAIEMVSLWSSETAFGGYSQKPSAPAPGFGIVAGGRRLMERQPRGVMHNDFVACNAYRGGEVAAACVACPALAILGSHDAMTPARSGRSFVARIAGVRVVEIPLAGHFLMAEAPDATLDALTAFLQCR